MAAATCATAVATTVQLFAAAADPEAGAGAAAMIRYLLYSWRSGEAPEKAWGTA